MTKVFLDIEGLEKYTKMYLSKLKRRIFVYVSLSYVVRCCRKKMNYTGVLQKYCHVYLYGVSKVEDVSKDVVTRSLE